MRNHWLADLAVGIAILLIALSPAVAQGQGGPGSQASMPGSAAYLNPDLPAAQRAAALVSRMTLDEKVLQMQNGAPAIERLGIPAYNWWNEALHGVARAGQATVFPQTIGLAAMWDTGMMRRVADAISTEARAKYNEAIRNNDHSIYRGLNFWSPNINIFRDPRWGRGQETYGEDPYLTARLGVAFIQGMQGDDPKYFKVIATPKHFAVHSGPEAQRMSFNAVPSERDMVETYLPAFKAAIMEGKADSVMCSYNAVNGAPACANADLLEKRLRGDWGFKGFVVSDCGAIGLISRTYKYRATAAEGSAIAVQSGTDLTCGQEYRTLTEAVKNGQIKESEIDRSVVRLFEARFRLGMFDPPERVPFSKIPYSVVDSAEHRKLALEAARKSIVLLKNENQVLPLKSSLRKIAVIGPAADDTGSVLGNYNGMSSKQVAPLEGIERRFGGKAEIRYAMGATYTAQSLGSVPASVLTPPDGTGHGVLAEYFEDASFQGSPKLRRVEPRPYTVAGFRSSVPDPALAAAFGAKPFTVRWTGTLRAPFSGDYVIWPNGAGSSGMRVFLDDKDLLSPTPTPAPAAQGAAAAAPQGGRAPQGAPGAAGRGGFGRGRQERPRVPLEAGRTYRLRVEYTPSQRVSDDGFGTEMMWAPPAQPLLEEAVAAVKDADVALAFVGLNPSLEGEGGDRANIDLPEPQVKLLEAAVATGKPVVVVLSGGSALAINFAAERAAAVLATWYGGEEIGTAIADTLAGANNPAGRLPITFYKSADQLPPFEDYAMKGRTYRYFQGEPIYGFGFGLSYSKFQYSGLRSQHTAKGATVTARVKNVSSLEGDEVVQLYLNGGGAPGDPIRQLRGFQRLHLRPGETREVSFPLASEDVPKAKTHISVGGGQPVGTVARIEGEI